MSRRIDKSSLTETPVGHEVLGVLVLTDPH